MPISMSEQEDETRPDEARPYMQWPLNCRLASHCTDSDHSPSGGIPTGTLTTTPLFLSCYRSLFSATSSRPFGHCVVVTRRDGIAHLFLQDLQPPRLRRRRTHQREENRPLRRARGRARAVQQGPPNRRPKEKQARRAQARTSPQEEERLR